MTFQTLQKFNQDEANPFDVVHTSSDTYVASDRELVITEANEVSLPAPEENAIVGIRDTGQRAVITSPSGQIHLREDGVIRAEETVYFVSDGTNWYTISDSEWFGADIPDSEANQKLAHRWVLHPDNGGLSFADSVDDADGVNNGISRVDGSYADGTAGDGDGVDDHFITDTLGGYGELNEYAISFTISTTAKDDGKVCGVNAGWDALYIDMGRDDDGELTFVRGNSTDEEVVEAHIPIDISDGGLYRIVININDLANGDIDVYVNQTDESANVSSYESVGDNWNSFGEDWVWFAENHDSDGPRNHIEAILDDLCLFDEPLNEGEAKSYDNPWG